MIDKQKMKRVPRRWDKVLAKWYGIPTFLRRHSKRHGGGSEQILSNWVQMGIIQFKPLPEDKEHAIYWRQA